MNLDNLESEFRRLIDIREGIGREIAACRARIGENTRRRQDEVNKLQEEYNRIQQRIFEIDKQMRAAQSARTRVRA